MRKAILVLFFLISLVFVFAAPGEVIPYGDSFYDDIDTLFILNGQTIPSASRPWTKAEARNELAKLDRDSLDSRLTGLLARVESVIEDGASSELKLEIALAPQVYIHTNEEFSNEDLWIFDYNRRSPFLTGSLDAYSGGFASHTELSLGMGRVTASDVDNADELIRLDSFPVDVSGRPRVTTSEIYSVLIRFNLPLGSGFRDSEVQTPRTAWITYSWKNGSIGVYKSKKSWGETALGNFVYDPHVSTYNYLSLKVFNSIFSFDYSIMAPYSYLGGSANSYEMQYPRLFLSHRLQAQISRRFSVAASENVMYWLRDGLESAFINPALIYHNNIENNIFNALAHVELEYVPVNGMRVYFQFGLDQGSVPLFEKPEDEDQAMGFLFGAHYMCLTEKGIADAFLEAAYVTPAMYRRGAQCPDFILADLTVVNDGSYTMVPILTFMGFPYGGDMFAVKAGAGYRAGSLGVSASAAYILHGEQSAYANVEGRTGFALTGNPSSSVLVEIETKYSLTLFDRLPANLSASVAGVFNEKVGFDLQIAVGFSTSYGLSILEK